MPWSVEGVDLVKVVAEGSTLTAASGEAPGYEVDGTIMRMRLPKAIPSGGSAELAFDWKLRVPPDGAPREGQDGEVYYIGYWYPQMAVYDDINGWQIDQYLGNAEFYMGYGDYDVSLTVPAGWIVTGTGALGMPATSSAHRRVPASTRPNRPPVSCMWWVRTTGKQAGRPRQGKTGSSPGISPPRMFETSPGVRPAAISGTPPTQPSET